MERATHIPVMLQRVLELIETAVATVDNPVVVDMTLGLGGHTEAILERFDQVTVIGVDRDLQAIARAKERLARFGSRVRVVHGVDDQIVSIVQDEGFDAVDVVFFDLGVSSMQLDFAERGFAYAQDGPLDMRMNEQDDLTAADLLNTYTEDEIFNSVTRHHLIDHDHVVQVFEPTLTPLQHQVLDLLAIPTDSYTSRATSGEIT